MLALPAGPTSRRTGSSSGAGRPTTANVYTGSVATTRARSSVATQGMALARWPGWVEGWSPTTRSTPSRLVWTHGLRPAAPNASSTWAAARGGKATWWNTRPSRRSSPRAPSSTTAGPVRPPASRTAPAIRSRRPVATSTGTPAASSSRTAWTEAGWMRSAASESVPSRSVTTSWTAPLPRGSGTGMERAYPLLLVRRPRRRWSLLGQAEAVVEPAHGRRGPPVPAAHQLHGRRDQQHPDHGGVKDHGDGHAEGDRPVVVAGLVPGLLDPREQEHLVVHGQPEGEHEDQHRDGDVDHARRVEAEQPGQVALLEHPHQGAEAGPQRQHVHDDRLDRHHHRPGHEEQQGEGGQPDQPKGVGQPRGERVAVVDQEGGRAGDPGRDRPLQGP